MLGWPSTQWINGGTGSGQCLTFTTDLFAALRDYGVSYNEDLTKMYQDFLGERPNKSSGALNSYPEELCRLYEPSISDVNYYTQALLDGAKTYSDTALVVLGRFTGESNDCPTVQYKQTTRSGDIIEDTSRTYLNLSSEEEELLAYVGENFENVIVLVNTTNTIALGPIETIPGIDAALLVGGTGNKAAAAIPEVPFGDVNPSGHVTDTYAYDFRTAASFANIGKDGTGAYTNGEGLYPYDGTTNGNLGVSGGVPYEQVSYVDYVEGIYVGYELEQGTYTFYVSRDAPITTGAKNGLSVTNSNGTFSDLGLKLGAVWAGASQALLKNVLRDEWGFEGAANTAVFPLTVVALATVNKGSFICLQSLGKAAASTGLSLVREIVFGVGLSTPI